MLKIAVILSSTRDARFGDKPAQWILDVASQRDDLEVELVDLKSFDLPFFNELGSNKWLPSQDENAKRWQQKMSEFDGYIFVTAEYNHSITAALKNALDQAYVEWGRKPAAYVGYGGLGAARAIEHLRLINIEAEMVPLQAAVHIAAGDFFTVSPMGAGKDMSEIAGNLEGSATAMLDQLTWWGNVLRTARSAG